MSVSVHYFSIIGQGQSEKEPITMYFNSPGSMTKPALAVFDVMRRMKCPIVTINSGTVD